MHRSKHRRDNKNDSYEKSVIVCDCAKKFTIDIIPKKLPSIKNPDFYKQFEIYYTYLENKKYYTKRNHLNCLKIEVASMIIDDKWCDCTITKKFREFPKTDIYRNSLNWKYAF